MRPCTANNATPHAVTAPAQRDAARGLEASTNFPAPINQTTNNGASRFSDIATCESSVTLGYAAPTIEPATAAWGASRNERVRSRYSSGTSDAASSAFTDEVR